MRVIIMNECKELKDMNVNATFIAPRMGEKVKCDGDDKLYEVVSICHRYDGDEPVMTILVY